MFTLSGERYADSALSPSLILMMTTGNSQKRWRKKLPRILIPQAPIFYNICICRQRRSPGHVLLPVEFLLFKLLRNPPAWAAGNSVIFGEYILQAANVDPGRWTLRLVGFACITFSLLIHGTALKWGLRLQNFLGVLKILVLIIVIITGFVALAGHMKVPKPNNFSNAFEGTTASASSFCLSLYNVRRSTLFTLKTC